MKKIFMFVFAMMTVMPLLAQDVIITKAGDEIQAKVLMVRDDVIEYNEWSNQEGPAMSIKVADVFMIRYQNGEKDVFAFSEEELANDNDNLIYYDKKKNIRYKGSSVNWFDAGNILKDIPEAMQKYSSGKTMVVIGDILSFAGGFTIGWGLGGLLAGKKDLWKVSVAGFGVLMVGLPISFNGQKNIFKSFDIYNESVKKNKETAYWSFGISETGGFSLIYNF